MTTLPKPTALSNSLNLKYDAWNRLVAVVDPSIHPTNSIVKCEYDGFHRRIVKESPSEIRHYYYSEGWQVIEERVETGGGERIDAQYVWNPEYVDSLALRYWDDDANSSTASVYHFYLQDANYNVTAVTNNSGAVVERYAYTPYGEVTILNGASDADSGVSDFSLDADQQSDVKNVYLYTGRERDAETRLQNSRYRFYAPHLGRWVQRDPIGYDDELSLYGYVGEFPTRFIDPWGLAKELPSIDGRPDLRDLSSMACPAIAELLDSLLREFEKRHDDLLIDPHGLYGNPSPPPGTGTYPGHQQFFDKLREYMRHVASFLNTFCSEPVPEEVEVWLNEPTPEKPVWAAIANEGRDCERYGFPTLPSGILDSPIPQQPCYACHPIRPRPLSNWSTPSGPLISDDCARMGGAVVVVGGTTYFLYRCSRMLPSLLPPLWPTIPPNIAIP